MNKEYKICEIALRTGGLAQLCEVNNISGNSVIRVVSYLNNITNYEDIPHDFVDWVNQFDNCLMYIGGLFHNTLISAPVWKFQMNTFLLTLSHGVKLKLMLIKRISLSGTYKRQINVKTKQW